MHRSDRLKPGDDILCAGLTIYDDRLTALVHQEAWCAIHREWSRTDLQTISIAGDSAYTAFEQRVDHLKGLLPGGYNDTYYLTNATLIDDDAADAIDVLTGSAGEDWFLWLRGEDQVNGASREENEEDNDGAS